MENSILKKFSNISKLILYFLLISGLVFIIFSVGKNNLSNENLWFDESGQFWMAKGLSHYSPPLSKEGNLIEVIRQNSLMNLDPGGFTVILHYWSKISNSILWLRMLPFTFYILTIVTIGLITYQFSGSKGLSLISMFLLPVLRGDLLYYAFEIRAFSMEYFGIAISLLLLIFFLKKKTNKNLLLLMFVMAIFCTSRYSFIVFSLIVSLITFIFQKDRFNKIKYYLPLIISLALIYFISYRVQFHGLKSPDYTSPFMFKYLSVSEVVSIVKSNLFSQNGLFSTLLSILGIVIFFFTNISKEQKILITSFVFIMYSFSFCTLSFLGIHPWSVFIRWNISTQIINAISLSIIVGYLFGKLKVTKNSYAVYAPIVILFFILITGKYVFRYLKNVSHYYRTSPNSISANIYALNIQQNNMFYVSEGDIPTWKYLNEYGSLKNTYYPSNTIIGKKNNEPTSKINYVIQSGRDDINFSDSKHIQKFKNITIYEPSQIYEYFGK
jgi:hypothetical protein